MWAQAEQSKAAWGHPATQQCPTTGTRGKHSFREAQVSAGMVPASSSSPSPSRSGNMLKSGFQSQCQPYTNGEVGTSSSPVTHGPACQILADTVTDCRLVESVTEGSSPVRRGEWGRASLVKTLVGQHCHIWLLRHSQTIPSRWTCCLLPLFLYVMNLSPPQP